MLISNKYLILLLLVIPSFLYTDEVSLIIARTSKARILNNDENKYITLQPGEIVIHIPSIDEKNKSSSNTKVNYNGIDVLISSWNLIDPQNIKTVRGQWIKATNNNILNRIKYIPFKGTEIIKVGEVKANIRFSMYETKSFNGVQFVFIYSDENNYGWIKQDEIMVDNKIFYSITPENNLKKTDLIEIDLLSKNEQFNREGLRLKISSMNITLTDDFSNNLHHKRYRAYSVINDNYVVYSELNDIHLIYHVLDIESNTALKFLSPPIPNSTYNLIFTVRRHWDNDRILYASIIDLTNTKNIQKVLQVEITLLKPADNINSYWTENNSLIIELIDEDKTKDKIVFTQKKNYWTSDTNHKLRQYLSW